MTAKRFFILKDDEEEDTLPVIRDRIFKIDDIYGHYKYDDIEQICLFLNEQNNEIEMLKSKLEDCEFSHRTEMAHHRVIEKDLKKENEHLKEENKELKEKNEFVGLLANHRGELVSFANALIQDLDDETIQDMWERFKDEMYKEWKQKRGIE